MFAGERLTRHLLPALEHLAVATGRVPQMTIHVWDSESTGVAMIPPPGISDIWIHEAKVAGGSLLLVLSGLIIYWRATRKQLA